MDDEGARSADPNGSPVALGSLRGLRSSVGNNASAYGFSVTITAAFGLLTTAFGTPTAPEIFAFALVELVVSGGFTRAPEDEPGNSVSVLSVGASPPGPWGRSSRRRPTCSCPGWNWPWPTASSTGGPTAATEAV